MDTPDAPSPPPGRARAVLDAGLLGASAGAVLGILDALRSAVDAAGPLPGRLAPAAVGVYAGILGVAALPAALVLSAPAARAGILAGAAALGVGLAANYWFLPSFLDPVSLAADGGLLIVAALLWQGLAGRFRAAGVPRRKPVALVAAGCVLASLGLAILDDRGDGPPPVVVRPGEGRRPPVLLVVVDTLRADAVGFSAAPGAAATPRLDALAAESSVFLACRAPSSWTKPSTASLLTGLYPPEHGALEPDAALPRGAATLAEVFRAAGWRTAAFSDNPWISPVFGYGQGFDRFHSRSPSALMRGTLLLRAVLQVRAVFAGAEAFAIGPGHDAGARDLLGRAVAFLEDATDPRPAFAYVHLIEPHAPYTPRPPHGKGHCRVDPPPTSGLLPFDRAPALPAADVLAMRANYLGEVSSVDEDLGAALDRLRVAGRLDSMVLCVTSDHGEEFHEHGGWTHGQSLYEELVRVPLLIRAPRGTAAAEPRRIEAGCSLVDVAPTLLELAGVATDAPCSGRSQVLVMEGATPAPRYTTGEVRAGPVRARSIHAADRVLVLSEKGGETAVEYFDLAADPTQHRGIGDAHGREGGRDALLALLLAEFRRMERDGLAGARTSMDPETEASLRALGYLGGR